MGVIVVQVVLNWCIYMSNELVTTSINKNAHNFMEQTKLEITNILIGLREYYVTS